jgi:allophanate hydrolase subunit 2
LLPSLSVAKTITEILHFVQDDNAMNAVVTRAGFLTSVQDLGRTGFRQFGVSTSGALDSFALRVANLLVGNDEGAAGLEITLGDWITGVAGRACRAFAS